MVQKPAGKGDALSAARLAPQMCINRTGAASAAFLGSLTKLAFTNRIAHTDDHFSAFRVRVLPLDSGRATRDMPVSESARKRVSRMGSISNANDNDLQ